jgi:hypothetical protein
MKLICPACGATASAEAWANDTVCRELLAVVAELPSPVAKVMLGYLGLFRPAKSALSWRKALRIALEIKDLTGRGYVQCQGRIDRNCPTAIWAAGMEQMLAQRDRLSLPMPNHNYLRKVVYDLAERADGQQESRSYHDQQINGGRRRAPAAAARAAAGDNAGVENPEADPALDPLEKARREWDARVARGEVVNPDLNNLSNIVKGMD